MTVYVDKAMLRKLKDWAARLIWRFIIYTCFERYPGPIEAPETSMWVAVADCWQCGRPVMMNRGAHSEPDPVDHALACHFFMCRGQGRGENRRAVDPDQDQQELLKGL